MKQRRGSTLWARLTRRGDGWVQLGLSPTACWPEPQLPVDEDRFSKAIADGRDPKSGWMQLHQTPG